jgi:hypothetical protein
MLLLLLDWNSITGMVRIKLYQKWLQEGIQLKQCRKRLINVTYSVPTVTEEKLPEIRDGLGDNADSECFSNPKLVLEMILRD